MNALAPRTFLGEGRRQISCARRRRALRFPGALGLADTPLGSGRPRAAHRTGRGARVADVVIPLDSARNHKNRSRTAPGLGEKPEPRLPGRSEGPCELSTLRNRLAHNWGSESIVTTDDIDRLCEGLKLEPIASSDETPWDWFGSRVSDRCTLWGVSVLVLVRTSVGSGSCCPRHANTRSV